MNLLFLIIIKSPSVDLKTLRAELEAQGYQMSGPEVVVKSYQEEGISVLWKGNEIITLTNLNVPLDNGQFRVLMKVELKMFTFNSVSRTSRLSLDLTRRAPTQLSDSFYLYNF